MHSFRAFHYHRSVLTTGWAGWTSWTNRFRLIHLVHTLSVSHLIVVPLGVGVSASWNSDSSQDRFSPWCFLNDHLRPNGLDDRGSLQ